MIERTVHFLFCTALILWAALLVTGLAALWGWVAWQVVA
jgi:hypothetical protein